VCSIAKPQEGACWHFAVRLLYYLGARLLWADVCEARVFPGELRALHAVAQSGSIRKASELLGIAPSSVSRKLALLEHHIGTTLLDRTSGGVKLTHAGSLVAEYARSVILDYDSLRADLNDWRGSRRKLIRIQAVESIVSGGLVDAVAAFRGKYDAVSFRLMVVPAPQVVEDVRRGDCDLGVTFCCPPQPDIVKVASVPEPIMLVVPNGHPLSAHRAVSLGEIGEQSLALPDITFGYRRLFDRVVQEAGLTTALSPAFTSNMFEALRDFVRCGAGVAVLPYRAVLRESAQNTLRAVPIDHPVLRETTVDVITLRKHHPARVVSNFIDQLLQTLAATAGKYGAQRAKP
jgi:molybdate transport repressor ModE-like protein